MGSGDFCYSQIIPKVRPIKTQAKIDTTEKALETTTYCPPKLWSAPYTLHMAKVDEATGPANTAIMETKAGPVNPMK